MMWIRRTGGSFFGMTPGKIYVFTETDDGSWVATMDDGYPYHLVDVSIDMIRSGAHSTWEVIEDDMVEEVGAPCDKGG